MEEINKDYHLVVADGGKKEGLAYGSYKVFDDKGKLIEHKQIVFGHNTSNQAEYLALISALNYCVKNKMLNVVVLMDSLLVVSQVKKEWNCLNPGLIPLLGRAHRLVEELESFEINHINNRYVKQKLGH